MKTKIVYVVISGGDDIYFEQVWASSWSLKQHNPNAHITVLTDEATKQTIKSDARIKSLECIDEIKTVTFDKEYSNSEKSRWIKTSMRNLLDGDFLFVDADTIITGTLDDVDSWDCSIGAVLDSHCHSREICDGIAFQDMYINRLYRLFGVVYNGEDVFNSGVLYVKDDEKAHHFFEIWHKNWQHSNSHGFYLDQLPMLKTNIELGEIIKEIPGEYNCQIKFSIQFLTRAIIIHTFSSTGHSNISVLLGSEIFEEIQQNQCLTSRVKNLLLTSKEQFASPSYLIDKRWNRLSFQPAIELVNATLDSKKMFDRFSLGLINYLARVLRFISRHICF